MPEAGSVADKVRRRPDVTLRNQQVISVPALREVVRYCAKCGKDFTPKRNNQRYCSPEHRPPNYTLRLTAAQADLILDIASRLRSD